MSMVKTSIGLLPKLVCADSNYVFKSLEQYFSILHVSKNGTYTGCNCSTSSQHLV